MCACSCRPIARHQQLKRRWYRDDSVFQIRVVALKECGRRVAFRVGELHLQALRVGENYFANAGHLDSNLLIVALDLELCRPLGDRPASGSMESLWLRSAVVDPLIAGW